ncbi:MAG: PD-(D/E)XK nuclease domain-containing protein [Prevotellaceae bacterium]|jgi:hypothetical protein|nr:PD-(D/E)XK nuclease domain-containing protein [Prevotellaceae bacterium]
MELPVKPLREKRKVTIDKLIGEAFRQIKEKKYHECYADGKHRVTLLAVAFAGKKIACQME